MAHGLPDFYRGVDIAYQALAELIIRPKYGAAELASGSVAVGASAETSLCTVAGKGMVYGGVIMVDSFASQDNSIPKIYCDGQSLSEFTILQMMAWMITNTYANALYQLRYNNVTFDYTTAIGPYLTFESSMELAYDEKHGIAPTVAHQFFYALI